MITKKMLCEAIVSEFVYDNNMLNENNAYRTYRNEKDIPYLVQKVFSSTRFGIALVELGVITKEKYPSEYEYLSQRAGIIIDHYDMEKNTNYFFTMRELLNMLPETLEENKEEKTTDINEMPGPPYL